MFKTCSYGSNVEKPKLVIFLFRRWKGLCSINAKIRLLRHWRKLSRISATDLLSVEVSHSDSGEKNGEDKLDDQDENENDGVGAVLDHDVRVDDGMHQDLLLVSCDRVEHLRVEVDGGGNVETDHESLRVHLIAVTADVVIQEILSHV